MAKHSRPRTISLPWRRVCAATPSIALICGGIAVTAPASSFGAFLPKSSAATGPDVAVVPDTALTMHRNAARPLGQAANDAPALVLPEGALPGSSTLVTLDSMGIPVRALEAYRHAAAWIQAADPACNIDWALVAAIGRVESDHARFGGNQLDSAGVARPGIIGIALDGSNGTALITDTDGGRLDRDNVYDRAVGPMQFMPGTWSAVGSDSDGDGAKNPQDMADAASTAAIYLCSGPGDLRRPDDLRSAVMRYNSSDAYARTVTAIADAYRRGVVALPASELPAAHAASSRVSPTTSPTSAAAPAPAPAPARTTPNSTPTGQRRPVDPGPSPSTSPTSSPPAAPAVPVPGIPAPGPTSATTGMPAEPLTEVVCTTSPLGARTCTNVPLP